MFGRALCSAEERIPANGTFASRGINASIVKSHGVRILLFVLQHHPITHGFSS